MLKLLKTYWPWIIVPIVLLAAVLLFALTRDGSAEFGYAM